MGACDKVGLIGTSRAKCASIMSALTGEEVPYLDPADAETDGIHEPPIAADDENRLMGHTFIRRNA